MAEFSFDTVTDVARDAFYVTVGAGVLAFQKAQVQRQELTKLAKTQLEEARGNAEKGLEEAKDQFDSVSGTVSELVDDRVKLVEERLGALEERLEDLLAQLEGKLPEQARDLVKQARDLVARAA